MHSIFNSILESQNAHTHAQSQKGKANANQ